MGDGNGRHSNGIGAYINQERYACKGWYTMSSVPQTLEFDHKCEKKKNRDSNIELGRICCCISIIGIHTFVVSSYDFNVMPVGNAIFKTGLSMFATPFFFLTMGAFMSSRTPYLKQWTRFLKKIIIPCIFTLFFMVQLTPLAKGEIGVFGSLTELHIDFSEFFWSLATLSASRHFQGFGHLWFIECLFVCYIFLPIFKIFLHDSPIENYHKRNVFIVGVVSLVVPYTLRSFGHNAYLQNVLIISEYPFLWVWLLLLGNYIHAWMSRNSVYIGVYVVWITPFFFALFCILNLYLTSKYDLNDDLTIRRFAFTSLRSSITVLLPNILPFIWFHCIEVKNAMRQKLILWVSEKCFYMYLVHMLILIFLRNYLGVNNNRFLGNLAHWISCCIISFLIACIFKEFERRLYTFVAMAAVKIKHEITCLCARLREISSPW